MREDATSCDSNFDATPYSTTTASDASNDDLTAGSYESSYPGVSAEFRFGTMGPNVTTGAFLLCYKFAYAQQMATRGSSSFASPTPYILFPSVRVAVIRYDSVEPLATGLGCVTNVTLRGRGFQTLLRTPSLVDPSAGIRCTFGGGVRYAGGTSTLATIADDSTIRCKSGRGSAAGLYPLRIDVTSTSNAPLTVSHPDTFPTWSAFDASEYADRVQRVAEAPSHNDRARQRVHLRHT